MATNKKISELTEFTADQMADDDLIVMVDVSDSTTKKVQASTFRATVSGVSTLSADAPLSVDAATGDVTMSLGTVAVAKGGTGATDAATARTNLGLGSIATQDNTSVNIDGGAIDGTTVGATTQSTGSFSSLTIGSATAVTDVDTDLTTVSASDDTLASAKAIKTYVDSQVGTVDTLSEILSNGNTTGANNIIVTAGQSVTTDTISETTAASGVTVDSLLIKDGGITAAGTSTFAGQTITDLGTVTTANINGGTITGITDLAVADGGTGASDAATARTNLGLAYGTNVRERLTAARTYYVRSDGSDSNTGLVDSSGGAFLTLQKAVEVIRDTLDLNGQTVTVEVGNNTWTAGITINGQFVGQLAPAQVHFNNTSGNPAINIISITGTGAAITVMNGAMAKFTGFQLQSSAGQGFLLNNGRADLGNTYFGVCGDRAIAAAGPDAFLDTPGNAITIVGNSPYFCVSEAGAVCEFQNVVFTVSPAATFTTVFYADQGSLIDVTNASNAGSGITGQKYRVESNATLVAASYTFPGSTDGLIQSGGILIDANGEEIVGGIGTFTTFTSNGIDDNATSTAVTINSSQNVGIGTSAPGNVLTVSSATQYKGFTLTNGTNTVADLIGFAAGNDSGGLKVYSAGVAKAQVLAGGISFFNGGNVGIGTSTPENPMTIQDIAGSTFNRDFSIRNGDATNYHRLILGYNAGSVASGVPANAQFLLAEKGGGYGTSGGLVLGNSDNAPVIFTTNATERMRIDSSGNVGIGTSSPLHRLHLFASGDTYSRFTTTSYTTGFDVGITSAGIAQNWNRNNTDWRVGTNNAERMRIDSSGNVGIATVSPNQKLHVVGSNSTGFAGATLQNSNGNVGIAGIQFSSDTTYSKAAIGQLRLNPNGTGPLVFYVDTATDAADWSTGDEKMRIDPSGTLRIGTTSGNADAKTTIYGGSTDSSPSLEIFKGSTTNTTSQVFMRFEVARDSTPVASGSITANGAAAATFTAWSDRKLKENIVDLSPQLENICKLKPSEFDFIGYPEDEGHQIGFIAQDMQEVYPDVVSEGKNGMLQISGWSKTEARLVKAIQEQQKIIETLEARVASLEAN